MTPLQIGDMFCGAGGSTTGIKQAVENLGRHCRVVAINHWEVAIGTHFANNSDVEHICASAEQLDPTKVVPGRTLDLLWASPACFPVGTLILTDNGLTEIENIREGNYVLTHKGRWRRVTKTFKTVKDTIVLKGHGHYGLETTENHPFLIRNKVTHWPKKNGKRTIEYEWTEPEWEGAKNIVGCFWGTQTNIQPMALPRIPGIDDGYFSDAAFWWIVGRWLGDGYISLRPGKGGEVSISCGHHEKQELSKRLIMLSGSGWHPGYSGTCFRFTMYNTSFASWLHDNFGEYAYGKRLPAWIYGLPKENKESFLEGYCSADGHNSGRKQEITTVSKYLAVGIRILAESLGHRVALHHAKQHCDVIEGRKVNVRDVFRIMWVNERKRNYATEIDGISWSRVKEITSGRKSIEVYNFSVEEDESYIADGIIVHNCTHHSVARGGRPRCEQQRAPAWIILHWLENLRVKRLVIENVPEFQNWGPLDDEGRIIKEAKGETFRAFIAGIRSLGYSVDWRVLNAADYGDPTVRRRLFIQAIRGTGRIITWPRETHVEPKNNTDGRPTWIPARDIIDWSIHGGSIFHRKKPLAPATLRRIEHGIQRFWQPYAEPFLVMLRGTGTSRSINVPLPAITAQGKHIGLVTPFILPNEGYYRGNKARSIDEPLPTITASRGVGALIEPFITRFHGGQDSEKRNHSIDDPIPVIDTSNRYGIVEPFITAIGHSSAHDRSRSIDEPLSTIVSKAEHCLIEPFLVKYYGTGGVAPVDIPLGTITAKEHYGLVEPGEDFLLDIRFRMLQPHEEAAAMSFPKDYVFRGTKGDIQKQIGNAVPVSLSRELAQNILSIEVA